MWNAFSGCLFSESRLKRNKERKSSKRRKYWFNKKIKENKKIPAAQNATGDGNDIARCNSDVMDIHGNKEDPDKIKEVYMTKFPELHDGYMDVSEFKRCEKFLTQPLAKILELKGDLKKPDIVHGYITEDANTDDDGKDMERKQSCVETQNENDSRSGTKGESFLQEDTLTTKSIGYEQKIDSDEKRMSLQKYANDAKMFTLSHLKKREERDKFISLPNLNDIKHMSKYRTLKSSSTKVFSTHRSSTLEIANTDESTESMEKVIEDAYVFPSDEHHQLQDLKRFNSVRRNSQQSEISTDSGRSSNRSSSSETRLKQPPEESCFCQSDCSKCLAVYMEYMVDVYEQLIVRQIRVTDIIDLLTVLDDRSKDMLRSKHKQSPHGAMELLIRIIKQSHAPGKWQCFYDAIEASEFTYISMLLKEETEYQYNYSTEVLGLIKPELKNRIYFPDFLDKVFERQLITEEEKDEANSLSDMEAKTYILDRIDKHLPNWNQVLIEVLNDSFMGDLAELFKLVSDKDSAPKLKEEEDRNVRRVLRHRRKNIMKIAHGATRNQSASKLPSITNEFVSDTTTVGELGTNMEKAVTNLTTVVDELQIRLRDNESEMSTTLLQEVICKQNKLNYQQEYLCSEIQNIRKEMTKMNNLLLSVVR